MSWRASPGKSLRVVDNWERIIDAAFEIAQVKVWRQSIYKSTIRGRWKLDESMSPVIPSLGNFCRHVNKDIVGVTARQSDGDSAWDVRWGRSAYSVRLEAIFVVHELAAVSP